MGKVCHRKRWPKDGYVALSLEMSIWKEAPRGGQLVTERVDEIIAEAERRMATRN